MLQNGFPTSIALFKHCLTQALPYIQHISRGSNSDICIVHFAWLNLGQAVADATIPPAALLMQSLLDGVGQDKNKLCI